jgi:hypothetical protein
MSCIRRQTFAPDPAVPYKLMVPASGEESFEKHGAYLEIERSMTDTVTLLVRADGLYRAGNLPAASPLATRAAVFRYTAGGTLAVAPGFRLKASAELGRSPTTCLFTRISSWPSTCRWSGLSRPGCALTGSRARQLAPPLRGR